MEIDPCRVGRIAEVLKTTGKPFILIGTGKSGRLMRVRTASIWGTGSTVGILVEESKKDRFLQNFSYVSETTAEKMATILIGESRKVQK